MLRGEDLLMLMASSAGAGDGCIGGYKYFILATSIYMRGVFHYLS